MQFADRRGWECLTRRRFHIGAAFLQQLNHSIQVGISSAELPREPVSTAFGYPLAIGENFKLTGFARRGHNADAEALLYESREPRDLGFVVLSRRTRDDLDLHRVLQVVPCACQLKNSSNPAPASMTASLQQQFRL